jgi:hypothetical protein
MLSGWLRSLTIAWKELTMGKLDELKRRKSDLVLRMGQISMSNESEGAKGLRLHDVMKEMAEVERSIEQLEQAPQRESRSPWWRFWRR